MRDSFRYVIKGAIIGLVFAISVAATEQEWPRVDAFDSNLSIATPCSASELILTKNGGKVFGARQSEARCEKNGLRFIVKVFELLGTTPNKSLYDQISPELARGSVALRKPSLVIISGHRASLDRSEIDGLVAQQGFVEINSTKVALLMAGGTPGTSSKIDIQRINVERFFHSLQVRD